MSDNILNVRNLKAYYQMEYYGISREVRAVDDITMSVRRNEVYGIAGESSSGKTTFIKVLAAAVRPPLRVVDGSVEYEFDGQLVDPQKMSEDQLRDIRWKHLSYIMQGSMSVLNPVRRIKESFKDFAQRPLGLKGRAFWDRIEEHLGNLKLSPEVLDAFPHELSGGMRQRVTIGLATVCEPEFIIADEPTTALDVVVQKDVLSLLRRVQQQIGSSLVLVTHDMSVHANMTDRVGIIYAGRLVEEGPTKELFQRPKHPYTAHLVGSLPRIGDREQRQALEGKPPNLADPPQGCRFHPRCPLATEKCRQERPPLETIGTDHRVACFHSDQVKPLIAIGHDRSEVTA